MNSPINNNKVSAGDIILVQGDSFISKMIRWFTNCRYSHTGIICCKLSDGEFMVMEMLAAGLMIRPLFVYRGILVDLMKTMEKGEEKRAEETVLKFLDNKSHIGYNFKGFLYLGMILLPQRILKRSTQPTTLPPENVMNRKRPQGLYQWLCYVFIQVLAQLFYS